MASLGAITPYDIVGLQYRRGLRHDAARISNKIDQNSVRGVAISC